MKKNDKVNMIIFHVRYLWYCKLKRFKTKVHKQYTFYNEIDANHDFSHKEMKYVLNFDEHFGTYFVYHLIIHIKHHTSEINKNCKDPLIPKYLNGPYFETIYTLSE